MPKLIVSDSQGKRLRDLTSSGIAVGEVVGVGDTPGPVTFIAGGLMRREQNPPFFFAGDDGTNPNPWPVIAGSTIRIQAVAGPEQTLLDMTFPVHAPPPPPPPPQPTLTIRIADPNASPRGEGVAFTGTASLKDAHLEGWRQNMTYMKGGGSLTLENVRSIRAFREDSSQRYQGQGLYFGNPNENPPQNQWPGPATIRRCLFGWNGYRKPDGNLNGFRHGIYGGHYAGSMTVEDSIFVGNACVGVQVRRGGVIRRCVFIDNGIGLLSVSGDTLIEDCVILGGHRYANTDEHGAITSWTGNNAVSNYVKLTLRNCLFAGVPGQAATSGQQPPQFDMGCVMNSRSYPPNPDWSPAGGSIDAQGCIIAGWPGSPFTGDRPHNGSGFTVKPGTVAYDPTPILDSVMANKTAILDACTAIMGDVRKLVA